MTIHIAKTMEEYKKLPPSALNLSGFDKLIGTVDVRAAVLGELLDLNERTIRRLGVEGHVARLPENKGYCRYEDSVRKYISHLRVAALDRRAGGCDNDFGRNS
jgi:hypothetical protein